MAAASRSTISAAGCPRFRQRVVLFHYLRDLPADYLKIDGSFVCTIDRNAHDQAVVAAINEVAHTLGIETIAEHVEDATTVGACDESVSITRRDMLSARRAARTAARCCVGGAPSGPMTSTGR